MKRAIILAAGMGTRLKPYTDKEHKCMTKVNEVPIIYNALCILEKCGIDEIVIVLGYLKERVRTQIAKFGIKAKITFVDNDEFAFTNTIYSLQKALHAVTSVADELYILEGDVFFEQSIIEELMACEHENATVLEPYNDKLEGTFAELNKEGYVIDWRHKSDQNERFILTDKYKTVNIHKFNNTFVESVFIPQLDQFVKDNGKNVPMEKLLRKIVQSDQNLIWGDILKKKKWFEIDDINDLQIAEKIFV